MTKVGTENEARKALERQLIAKCERMSPEHLKIFLAAVGAIEDVGDDEVDRVLQTVRTANGV